MVRRPVWKNWNDALKLWWVMPPYTVPWRLKFFDPLKTNIDTKNDGLEDVSPFKHGYFG